MDKLKEAMHIVKSWACTDGEDFLSEQINEALKVMDDTCQKVLDLQGVMPKKHTKEELQNILIKLGATELHLAEIKNDTIDLCTLATAGKDNLIQIDKKELEKTIEPIVEMNMPQIIHGVDNGNEIVHITTPEHLKSLLIYAIITKFGKKEIPSVDKLYEIVRLEFGKVDMDYDLLERQIAQSIIDYLKGE